MSTPAPPDPTFQADRITVPAVEERMTLDTRLRDTGGVRLTRSIQAREVTVDERSWRESVEVERRPAEGWVDADAPPMPRHEGDTLVIPVLEEVLVVERRLRLKEELLVRRVRQAIRDPQTVTPRSEQVVVERLAARDPPHAAAAAAGIDRVATHADDRSVPPCPGSTSTSHTLVPCSTPTTTRWSPATV